MSTQPFTSAKFREFDANGAPLAGGLLYTYAAGTTTPLATYTTHAGDVANSNPVVLDANGRADVWLTPGVDYKFELRDSAGALQYTTDNYPSPSAETATTDVASTEPGGRLTLTSGTAVTTSDVTGAATLYYAPYKSDKVPLYDGATWTLYSVGTGLSQTAADNTKSPAGTANNSNYDVFIWNDSGTLRLSRGPAWTSDAGRGSGVGTTELTRLNGRHVNANAITNGPAAQRGLYVGTVRSDGSAQFNDSMAKRNVWNCHNRVRRGLKVTDATATWASGTLNVWRQVRATAANAVQMVRGLNEDVAALRATLGVGSAGGVGATGIGLNSTTVNSAPVYTYGGGVFASADYADLPGPGFIQANWLELYSQTGLASAFIGGVTSGVLFAVSGMTGHVLA